MAGVQIDEALSNKKIINSIEDIPMNKLIKWLVAVLVALSLNGDTWRQPNAPIKADVQEQTCPKTQE